MGDVITEKIGEGIELMIEGLPQSLVTPSLQAKAALELAKYSIPLGADLGVGLLGGIRSATLRIAGEIYQIKYSLVVVKALTALQVYSEAIQWIEFKKQKGIVDSQLADQTMDYLRSQFTQEFPK